MGACDCQRCGGLTAQRVDCRRERRIASACLCVRLSACMASLASPLRAQRWRPSERPRTGSQRGRGRLERVTESERLTVGRGQRGRGWPCRKGESKACVCGECVKRGEGATAVDDGDGEHVAEYLRDTHSGQLTRTRASLLGPSQREHVADYLRDRGRMWGGNRGGTGRHSVSSGKRGKGRRLSREIRRG